MGTATVKEARTGTESAETEGARLELHRRGVLPVTIAGGSMRPALQEGETVLVTKTSTYRPGEVALLSSFGTLLLHRLVARIHSAGREWYVHAGDAGGWGVAGAEDLLGRAHAPTRGVSARASAAAMGLRLGAVLSTLGIPRRLLRLFLWR